MFEEEKRKRAGNNDDLSMLANANSVGQGAAQSYKDARALRKIAKAAG